MAKDIITEPGSVLRLRKFISYKMDGETPTTVGAPHNEVFVCVILGTEPWKEASIRGPLCPEKAMNELGWFRIDKILDEEDEEEDE